MVWGVEEYNKAIQNYSQLLKEQPANADLLEKYQILCMEKARLEREEKVENKEVEVMNITSQFTRITNS